MNKINLGNDLYLKGRIGWQGLSKNEYLDFSEYRIINASALMNGYINWDNCGYITKERYEEAKEIMLEENDILISKDGTLGKIGYVKNLPGKCSVASGIFVLRNTQKEILNFDYLYHILKSHIFKDFIYRNKSLGSTINHLYQRDLSNFEIELPSITIQNKVSSVLNGIDNRISLNNKIITELESITKTIYNYWFLQFEFPNEEGKPYKSSGGKMVWNEELKREIPEGWTIVKLNDIAKIETKSIKPDINKEYQYYSIEAFDETRMPIPELGSNIASSKYLVPNDAVLVSKLNPQFKRLWDVGNITNDSICSTEFIPFISKNNSREFLYSFLNSDTFYKFMVQGSSSSTGSRKRMSPELMKSCMLCYPKDEQIVHYYCRVVKDMFNKTRDAKRQNQELTSLREFLLPLLMNGQVGFKKIDE